MLINNYIESTNLSITCLANEIDLLVSEALDFQLLGVCVPPFWVKRAARESSGKDLQIVTVVGYPLGYQKTESKIEEANQAIHDGANEIDLVLNCSAFANNMDWAKIETAKISKLAHDANCMIKLILETDLWDEQQLRSLLKICADAGIDFAKTSTGYHRSPVSPAMIRFFREHLPSSVGIKASGGIKTADQARELIKAGADRLGTSSAKELLG
ncbi:MAG: deoxyribose-phosphate aldolase [Cyclobacteriaceae bacterium]|jgi:deoxyribose-phosphate aldolase